MLVGNDISEFQGLIDWNTYKNNTNFVIMKAGEGNGYIDGWFGNNRQEARSAGLPRGFYHFARPDLGNTAEAEAQFFVNLLNGQPLEEGELLFLDYEVSYHDPVGWCKAWLDKVYELTTVKPLIYLNQSLVKSNDWSPVVNAGYGLWLASYNPDGQGDTGQWSLMAFQQTSSVQQVPGITGNVDRDVFFGDAFQFNDYGYKTPATTVVVTTPTEPPVVVQTTPAPTTTTQTPTEPPVVTTTIPTTTVPEPTVKDLLKQLLKKLWQKLTSFLS